MSGKFIKLADDFWAAPQLSPADMKDAAAEGFRLIVNNRPDGEMFGQPKSAEIEAAAKAAGLSYIHIPVSGGLSMDQLAAFNDAAEMAGGKVLGFCRSGLRSAVLRSYAAALSGRAPEELVSEAAAAGYDISGHRPALEALSKAGAGAK